jgi:hypothetical protein
MARKRDDGRDLGLGSSSGGQRHGAAEAVAQQHGRLAQLIEQGQQQVGDVPSHVEAEALAGRPPVEQQHPPARTQRLGERAGRVEVEDGRRVDQ